MATIAAMFVLSSGAALEAAPRAAVSASEGGEANSPTAEPDAAGGVVEVVLASGTRVLIEPEPGLGEVAVRAAWKGGGRRESVGDAGAHELLARTITRGCGQRGAATLARHADAIDVSIGGFATRDAFGIRAHWPAGRWDEGFSLFADCVRAPMFDARTFYRERERVQQELAASGADPGYQAFRLLSRSVFGDHPYGLDRRGTPASVDRIARRAVAALYRDAYPASQMTLAVVGDVQPEAVLDDVRALFDAAPPGASGAARDAPGAPAVERDGAREHYGYLDADRAFVAIGALGVGVADDDRHALEVFAAMLSKPRGRLASSLRERGVDAYDYGATSIHALDGGLVAVYAACAPGQRSAAASAIRSAIDEIAREGPTAAEVESAVRYLVQTHEAARRDPRSRAAALALHGAYGLAVERALGYADGVRSVTAEDVARVAAAYLAAERSSLATITPAEMTPGAAARIRGEEQAP